MTFGKISFYCDILKANLNTTKQQMVSRAEHASLITQLFKVQSLINRFHAAIYERDLLKEAKRFALLEAKYKDDLEKFEFKGYVVLNDPQEEIDEARNLYYKFKVDVVNSLKWY